ncbi:MAG: carbon-phosphorus lyase complex subunit PhnI [Spirochaetaceae bacterium]|jgi:alpha-D-ribose 1-methylphosphonate 5-triphosphate synthase subunit PhnI|nr:carbon-phosphorus lyase complex subunit PhnI [Spirochaetaceae bacterium]
MAYSAVRGGQEAVAESVMLLEKFRAAGSQDLELEALEKRMSLLIDRIMGEAGFYTPSYAAMALKQAEGSPEEAVFLLRAYRSTLSRSYLSLPLDGADMVLRRRISAAFKDVPGGQFLGATYDYTHRLLNFDLMDEKPDAAGEDDGEETLVPENTGETVSAPRVSEELRREGLITTGEDGAEPWDVTEHPLRFPAPRSARLQTLARTDTGYISGLAYAAIRGFGAGHPTVGELRTGTLEVRIPHPLVEGEEIAVGDITVTEVESLFPEEEAKTKKEDRDDPLRILGSGQGDKADNSGNSLTLGMGYGMVFGRNDTKAIAMSILDYALGDSAEKNGTWEESIAAVLGNQEFVLLHGDCLEMNGFISHLKLPHYVTFQSKLDRVRHTRRHNGGGDDRV